MRLFIIMAINVSEYKNEGRKLHQQSIFTLQLKPTRNDISENLKKGFKKFGFNVKDVNDAIKNSCYNYDAVEFSDCDNEEANNESDNECYVEMNEHAFEVINSSTIDLYTSVCQERLINNQIKILFISEDESQKIVQFTLDPEEQYTVQELIDQVSVYFNKIHVKKWLSDIFFYNYLILLFFRRSNVVQYFKTSREV